MPTQVHFLCELHLLVSKCMIAFVWECPDPCALPIIKHKMNVYHKPKHK